MVLAGQNSLPGRYWRARMHYQKGTGGPKHIFYWRAQIHYQEGTGGPKCITSNGTGGPKKGAGGPSLARGPGVADPWIKA